MVASEALRKLNTLALEISKQAQGKVDSSSPRGLECSALRATEGGGGRARVRLLDLLGDDLAVMAGNLVLMIEGVADCLEVAESRGNEVNKPALSATVRPTLEIAGQIAWLLEDSIDGQARARRYLIWRFSDLRHQYSILRDFRLDQESLSAATNELDGIEKELFEIVAFAKWAARPTEIRSNGDIQAAALLDGQIAEKMPEISQLIRLVSSTPSLYGLLSVTSHGLRFGAFLGLVADTKVPDAEGNLKAKMSGFGVPPNLVIGLACLAVVTAVNAIANWHRIDSSKLHRHARTILKTAGIGGK